MNITLNIGLSISKNYLPEGVQDMQWQYEYIKDYLNQTLGIPSCIGMAQSATEETIIAQYTNVEDVLQKLYNLAHELGQDCIAYAIQADGVTVGGALVGKYAHEWNHGIFDTEYFIPATIKLNYRVGLPL